MLSSSPDQRHKYSSILLLPRNLSPLVLWNPETVQGFHSGCWAAPPRQGSRRRCPGYALASLRSSFWAWAEPGTVAPARPARGWSRIGSGVGKGDLKSLETSDENWFPQKWPWICVDDSLLWTSQSRSPGASTHIFRGRGDMHYPECMGREGSLSI